MSLLTAGGGGAQKVAVELANYLKEHGHEVVLIDFEWDKSQIGRPFYQTAKGVALETVIKNEVSTMSGGLNGRIVPAGLQAELTWYDKNLSAMQQLSGIFGRHRPDLVVSFLPSTFTLVATVLKDTGISLVVGNQGEPAVDYTSDRYDPNPYDLKQRQAAPEQSVANVVLLDAFTDIFTPSVRKKTHVIGNPIIQSGGSNESKRRPIILSASRLAPVKNHAGAIRAFAKVAAKYPDWQLHIYGSGNLETELKRLIVKLGLGKQVFLKGVSKDMDALYRQASIYAQPSFFEGMSLALGEAMSHGLPCVVIDDCTSNRFIINKSQGGLSSANNTQAIASNFDKLMGDEQLRAKLGENARKYAAQFSREAVYSQWYKLLSDLYRQLGSPPAKAYEKLADKPAIFMDHYDKCILKAIGFYENEIDRQRQLVQSKKRENEALSQSRQYKLGHKLLAPVRKLRR